MAHYAFLDENNIVVSVIAGIDETELIEGLEPEVWYQNKKGQTCKRTSYNGNMRKRYAGIGFYYDPINDVFITPKPYSSWVLNEDFDWVSPVPKPDEGLDWVWNESLGQWTEIQSL